MKSTHQRTRRHLRNLRLNIFGFLFTSLIAVGQPAIHYDLRMENPSSHYFQITLNVQRWRESTLDVAMPAWSPGRYVIYDFARLVKEVQAVSGAAVLPVEKVDKQTWRIANTRNKDITISYKVYANTLSGTFSELNSDHANYNGASTFMYVVGSKQLPISLTVHPINNWLIVSGAVEKEGQREFRFPNYDILIDTPTEVSDAPVFMFRVEGKEYRVLIHTDADTTNFAEFLSRLQRMVAAQRRIMPEPDYERYVFLFHFGDMASSSDGMEHLNST